MIKGIINGLTKLQPISDIYKGKIIFFIFYLQRKFSKILKDLFLKDLRLYFLNVQEVI